ncbi:MAG: hypothetical protein GX610_09920 [Rhodococcus sp.]|nr:hypothetical protein [Rhodococcus sp. (in: high G+C Gram-positive bacteria)]
MAGKKDDHDGCFGAAGIAALVMIIGALTMIPKGVWIALGVIAGVAVAVWIGTVIYEEVAKRRQAQAAEDEKRRKAAEAAEKRRREDSLGTANAQCVETALASVVRIAQSRAARDGWLGDIDFAADITGIEAGFVRAQELRTVADELRALPEPTDDDRRLLDDAVAAAGQLELIGRSRVDLINQCAREALLVDESLRLEEERARTEEQRERLHGKLNSMLYGAAAASAETAEGGVADQILARVAGYREIKEQVARAGDDG